MTPRADHELLWSEPSSGNDAETSRRQSAQHVTVSDGPELSVIVPTYSERENVAEVVRRLRSCLAGLSWEVIFVDDDSPDGTAAVVREIACRDSRVRCVQRIGRRGLSSACIEGALASSAPYVAVMDADLQHDERLLPEMLKVLKDGDIDVVVASRYARGGSVGDWGQSRIWVSRVATWIGRTLLRAELSDPMSGFFMLRRSALEESVRNLSTIGFKLLLDIFASSPRPLRFIELPYEFRARRAGESKMDSHAAWDYAMLVIDKLVGHVIPARFVAFTFVGGLGVLVHFLTLSIVFKGLGASFVTSQLTATLAAMTFNFALNNSLTYRDRRLRGWQWLRGWVSFSLACSVGVAANVGIASYLFERRELWLVAALAGVLVSAVWNYAVTKLYTWRLEF
jgi:dolichol-phosphate mannosyltransferase